MMTAPDSWLPRVPLVTAERYVDYPRILNHILDRRQAAEKAALPTVKRLAYVTVNQTGSHAGVVDQLAARLERSLMATARFGYREARFELRRLRRNQPITVTAAYQIPDAGKHSLVALGGLDAIQRLVRNRARDAASAAATAAAAAAVSRPYRTSELVSAPVKVAAAAAAATRIIHNRILELVGETLNLGRAAGVLTLPGPPEFAMRSEQLDANTCDPCDQLHGEIVQIDTPEYWDLMPPQGCDGGGRCRGIYVYGDSADEMQQAA